MIFRNAIFVFICASQGAAISAREISSYTETSSVQSVVGQRLADASPSVNKQSIMTQGTQTHNNIDTDFSRNTFRTTDEETELLLQEILNLSSDIAIVAEEENGSQQHEVIVIVTLNAPKLFDLSYIELKINTQTVAAYQYTETDVNAMQIGGGHRLYRANLPAGIHKLSAFMLGRVPRDPDYKRDIAYRFIAGISRTVLELNIDSKDSSTYPGLKVKEWN